MLNCHVRCGISFILYEYCWHKFCANHSGHMTTRNGPDTGGKQEPRTNTNKESPMGGKPTQLQNSSDVNSNRPKISGSNGNKGKKNNSSTNGKNQRGGGKKGRAPEVQKKINDLRQATSGYFGDDEIHNVLQSVNFDQERALRALQDKRQNSWSAVVRKAQSNGNPTLSTSTASSIENKNAVSPNTEKEAHPPPVEQSGKTQRNQKKAEQTSAPVHNKQDNHQPAQTSPEPQFQPEKPFNADAKLADLEQQVAKDLSAIENKANYLKSIQEELRTVKAERDAQIQDLQTEKESMTKRREQLEKEMEQIKARVIEIDGIVKQLKLDKDQKIKILEEKYTRALQ